MKKITYRERWFIDAFRCIDYEKTICAYKTENYMNCLYCYIDRYNTKVISNENIIKIEEV